jgi:hypothetical protein
MSNIGCRRGRGVKSERPVQKARRSVAMGFRGFTISSWNVTTVDGCEILHHQKDGWNMLKPYKYWLLGSTIYQLVQDFFHPQHYRDIESLPPVTQRPPQMVN